MFPSLTFSVPPDSWGIVFNFFLFYTCFLPTSLLTDLFYLLNISYISSFLLIPSSEKDIRG